MPTTGDIGLTWDEPAYRFSQLRSAQWWERLASARSAGEWGALVEPDAPVLLPRDMRPRPSDGRNEPAFLPHVVRTIAQSLGRPFEEVADATTRTARAFFGLDAKEAA